MLALTLGGGGRGCLNQGIDSSFLSPSKVWLVLLDSVKATNMR